MSFSLARQHPLLSILNSPAPQNFTLTTPGPAKLHAHHPRRRNIFLSGTTTSFTLSFPAPQNFTLTTPACTGTTSA
jgi:hypothetical protein